VINSSESLYKSMFKDTTTEIPKLLLAYGADPNKRIKTVSSSPFETDKLERSPLLKAAEYSLPLLNLCIDAYGGDCMQTNEMNQTVLFIAFISKQINNPNEITFFKHLGAKSKKEFMMRELAIIANSTPQHVFCRYPRFYTQEGRKEVNDAIHLFY